MKLFYLFRNITDRSKLIYNFMKVRKSKCSAGDGNGKFTLNVVDFELSVNSSKSIGISSYIKSICTAALKWKLVVDSRKELDSPPF